MTKTQFEKALHDTLDFSINIARDICPKLISRASENLELKITVSALMLRSMTKAHAINVLLASDLAEEANVVLRILIEIAFVVGYICKDEKHFRRFQEDLEYQKYLELKDIVKATDYPDCMYKVDSSAVRKLEEMKPKFKKRQKLSVQATAEGAGMLGLYYSSYSTLCRFVHSGPSEVDDYLSIQNGRMKLSRSNRVEVDLVLFSAIEAMKSILNFTATVHSSKSEKLDQINEIYTGFNQILYDKYMLKKEIFDDQEA